MYMKQNAFLLCLLSLSFGCNTDGKNVTNEAQYVEEEVCKEEPETVLRKDTMGLIVLYPQYTSIDLVCGDIPSKDDSSVILFAEASYTGQCLDTFQHFNVAGDHVSAGKRYKGYPCKRNTGAFVYYNDSWKFCHNVYSNELDSAALHGGAGFGQELMIYKGKLVPIARKDGNQNQFRALCNHNGKLCIVESDGFVRFGDFKKSLLDFGISDAIYLDMGPGWNHAWYRNKGEIIELHPKEHDFCTNWITFYK